MIVLNIPQLINSAPGPFLLSGAAFCLQGRTFREAKGYRLIHWMKGYSPGFPSPGKAIDLVNGRTFWLHVTDRISAAAGLGQSLPLCTWCKRLNARSLRKAAPLISEFSMNTPSSHKHASTGMWTIQFHSTRAARKPTVCADSGKGICFSMKV